MPHLWVRAEPRANGERVGITPDGAAALIEAGFDVTVEDSATRAIPIHGYRDAGARIAAFGYWSGYVGAAVSLRAWAAQQRDGICAPLQTCSSADALRDGIRADLEQCGGARPTVLVIGAMGRIGRGAGDLSAALDVPVTRWNMTETAHGGPFPEVLVHDVFLNCILAGPGTPVLVPEDTPGTPRALRVIGDIACDPGSDFSPVRPS